MISAIESYLAYLRYEANASPLTIESYGDALMAYAAYCHSTLSEEHEPSGADLDLVRGWLSGQMDEGLKASTISRKLSAIKGMYRHLLKLGKIDKNPVASLRPPRGEKPLPSYVPTEYINALLAEEPAGDDLEGIRDRLILAILYECGLRRAELADLRDEDVDTIRRQLKVLGKGRKERIVPFGVGLTKLIEQWRKIRAKTFGASVSFFLTLRGKQMTGAGVYRVVHRHLEAVPNLSRRGAHTLRHSFATDMLNAGADLVAIKELMGHSNISTTVGYTHTSFKHLQAMYNAHPRAQKKK